jgi:Cu2+-containing amine oxidase
VSLSARISRLELKQGAGNPLDALTDDELEEAIEAINQSLADALGVSSEQMVDIPIDMDEAQVRALVRSIKEGQHG